MITINQFVWSLAIFGGICFVFGGFFQSYVRSRTADKIDTVTNVKVPPMPERRFVLLSNLVWGYHLWKMALPNPRHEEEPGADDPAVYFDTQAASDVIEELF